MQQINARLERLRFALKPLVSGWSKPQRLHLIGCERQSEIVQAQLMRQALADGQGQAQATADGLQPRALGQLQPG